MRVWAKRAFYLSGIIIWSSISTMGSRAKQQKVLQTLDYQHHSFMETACIFCQQTTRLSILYYVPNKLCCLLTTRSNQIEQSKKESCITYIASIIPVWQLRTCFDIKQQVIHAALHNMLSGPAEFVMSFLTQFPRIAFCLPWAQQVFDKAAKEIELKLSCRCNKTPSPCISTALDPWKVL